MSKSDLGLRAFVAMRIGHAETDALFRKSLSPALRAVGLTPVRIDKLEHNDDIDDRILAEIHRSDVVITDLTFARPSAYFEAGYASGMDKPVIYTARADHFHAKDEDPLGNLRVHFDLQMKNIISWSNTDSATFRSRLERRLRFVLGPLVRARQAEKAAADARAAFARLPVSRRLEAISDEIESAFRAMGYRLVRLGTEEGYPYTYATMLMPQRMPENLLSNGFVGTASSPGTIGAVWVRVEEGFTLSTLRPMDALLAASPPYDMNPPRGVRPNRVIDHVLLCSLRSVPTPRIQTAFRAYEQVEDGRFGTSMRQLVPTSRIRNEIILIGRMGYASWRAMGLDPGDEFSGARHYEAKDGRLQSAAPRPQLSIRFVGDRRERPKPPKSEVHGRVKEVPRRVNIHVIDEIRSLLALNLELDKIRERIQQERT